MQSIPLASRSCQRSGALRTQISRGAIVPVTQTRGISDGQNHPSVVAEPIHRLGKLQLDRRDQRPFSCAYFACEATALPPPSIGTAPQDFIASTRMRGLAVIGVRNVHPHDDGGGGVEFVLEVNWGSPLDIVTDITVDDPAETGSIV